MIALALFNCIDEEDGRASKWSLIKVLGNEAQFHYWIEDFMIKDGFINEIIELNRSFYMKTNNGEIFHKLLKNGNLMKALLRVSGKRLK